MVNKIQEQGGVFCVDALSPRRSDEEAPLEFNCANETISTKFFNVVLYEIFTFLENNEQINALTCHDFYHAENNVD